MYACKCRCPWMPGQVTRSPTGGVTRVMSSLMWVPQGMSTLVTAEPSLRTPGCCVVQAELGLLRFLLTQPPKCWNYMNTHHQAQQNSDFFTLIYLYVNYMRDFVRGGMHIHATVWTMEDRRQFSGIVSSSGCQVWQQDSLSTEPSHCPTTQML